MTAVRPHRRCHRLRIPTVEKRPLAHKTSREPLPQGIPSKVRLVRYPMLLPVLRAMVLLPTRLGKVRLAPRPTRVPRRPQGDLAPPFPVAPGSPE